MFATKSVSAACIAAVILLTACDPQPAVSSPSGGLLSEDPPSLKAQSNSAQASSSPKQSNVPAATATLPPQAGTPELTPQQRSQQLKNQQLIDVVEQSYKAGVDNYRAGHLEAAKASFDYAVDQMLSSGYDLKNDPQLSVEFDRIVDAVNTLELDALKQGNGFQPRAESAPVDVANDVTFAPDPALTAKVQAELKTTQSDLPLVLNDYVASFINFFANTKSGHATIVHSLTRSGRYKAMIQRILAQEGVPQDLIYQAVAESGFQPQIRNGRSGAGGMWQFMPGDAFAPPRSAWFDQRYDPEGSTRAYARYIKYLYNQLGDWYLAMAAYDWGAGNVQRAVQRTGYADFWELYRRNVLPQETKNYVPIILAAAIMAKNPKQYGLDSIVFDPPLIADTVVTNYSVDLRLVSDLVEAPVQEIVELNPSLLRMATPPDDAFDLHLPPGTKELFARRIEEVPVDRRKSWRFHKVESGDTLEAIAHNYRVSATEIAFVNQLGQNTDLSGIESLVIPVAAVASSSVARSTRYVARKGDTIVTVADRFNVSVDQLRSWNHLKGTALTPGHSLYVSEPARVTSTHGRRHTQAAPHAAKQTASRSAPPSGGVASKRAGKSKTTSSNASNAHVASAGKTKNHHSSAP